MPAADARLGRWLLLYGILQVLSTLSVDTEGIKYKPSASSSSAPEASYFLSPSLDNCPPWPPSRSLTGTRRVPSAVSVREASQRQSHCWVAPLRWEGNNADVAVELGAEGAIGVAVGGGDDGGGRVSRAGEHNRDSPGLFPPPAASPPLRGGGGHHLGVEQQQYGHHQRISELDGRLLNDRDRKVRMHQFEQKLLAQRREFEEYEMRYGGLRERVMGQQRNELLFQQQQQHGDHDDNGVGRDHHRDDDHDLLPPPLRSPPPHGRRGGEKEFGAGGGGEVMRGRGPERKEYGPGMARPDVPLRSPLRSPPGSRGGGGGGGGLAGGREKEMPRRMMEYFVDDDSVEAEGEREGEFLPGYAR